MEKPSGLSVIQGLHLYLVEARVGQCDSTHIAFCKCHPSMNPKEKSNVCVTFVGSRPFALRGSSHDFNQYFQLFKNSVRDMTDKFRTTRHSFSTLPMICSYQRCIQSLSFSQMFSNKPVPLKTLRMPIVSDHCMSTYIYGCKELFHKI